MKITFSIKSKIPGINSIKSIEISYEQSGHIGSLVIHGSLQKPSITLVPRNSIDLPLGRSIYVLDVSWCPSKGFEFNQYTDKSLSSSLPAPIGFLQSNSQIKLNGTTIAITFKAEVSNDDLNDSSEINLLENSYKYGINFKDIDFSEITLTPKTDLLKCQFTNANFFKCDLKEIQFSGCTLSNTSFTYCILDESQFEGCKLIKVKFTSSKINQSSVNHPSFKKAILDDVIFENSELFGCSFEECKVKYSPARILENTILQFHSCKLQGSKFTNSVLCCIFEQSNLTSVDFSKSTLVACKFYENIINYTNFSGVEFTSNTTRYDLICKIGDKSGQQNKDGKTKILNSDFTSALMSNIDLSHTHIENCIFEDADLRNAKIRNSIIKSCSFERTSLKPAKLSFSDLSFSSLEKSVFDEVDFYKSIMIKVADVNSTFIASRFGEANLRNISFIGSNLTGAFFGRAKLILANFDKCDLYGSNFYETERSGINLNITDIKGKSVTRIGELEAIPDKESKNGTLALLQSTCKIGSIQWLPMSNGEMSIDENTFLHIIIGSRSPFAILTNLAKDYPTLINIQNSAINSSTNVGSVENGSVNGSNNHIGDNTAEDKIDEDKTGEDSDYESQTQEKDSILDDMESDDSNNFEEEERNDNNS